MSRVVELSPAVKKFLETKNLSEEALAVLSKYQKKKAEAFFFEEKASHKAPSPVVKLEEPPKKGGSRKLAREMINEIREEMGEKDGHFRSFVNFNEEISTVMVLSDLHIGKIYTENGVPLFDTQIAKKALGEIFDKAIDYLKRVPTNSFTLVLAGDIVDGELVYPTHQSHIEGGAFEQMKFAASILIENIEKLRPFVKRLGIKCVAGNHGRASSFHDEMSNWDNVLYHSLWMYYKPSEYMTHFTYVEIASQMHLDFDISGNRFHVRHIGTPGFETASQRAKILSWANVHKADVLIWGHYHNPGFAKMANLHLIRNGCLPPLDDYAEKHGFLGGIGQWIFRTTKKTPVRDLTLLSYEQRDVKA